MPVKGKTIDIEARCVHYHTELDIIAIKFKCCDTYYACFSCHEEETNHAPQRWLKNEFETPAILCGKCMREISIEDYLACDNVCPVCRNNFNPKCSHHYHLYFEMD